MTKEIYNIVKSLFLFLILVITITTLREVVPKYEAQHQTTQDITLRINIRTDFPVPKPAPSNASSLAPPNQIFEVTAYTAGVESTGKGEHDKDYGITASGKRVRAQHTAACPPSMPFGERFFLPLTGVTYTCEDRGSAIGEGKLDIYIPDLSTARKFGRQKLEVEVIRHVLH